MSTARLATKATRAAKTTVKATTRRSLNTSLPKASPATNQESFQSKCQSLGDRKVKDLLTPTTEPFLIVAGVLAGCNWLFS